MVPLKALQDFTIVRDGWLGLMISGTTPLGVLHGVAVEDIFSCSRCNACFTFIYLVGKTLVLHLNRMAEYGKWPGATPQKWFQYRPLGDMGALPLNIKAVRALNAKGIGYGYFDKRCRGLSCEVL